MQKTQLGVLIQLVLRKETEKEVKKEASRLLALKWDSLTVEGIKIKKQKNSIKVESME